MKVSIAAIGRVKGVFADSLAEYEKRASRYFSFETVEIREHPSHRAANRQEVMQEEGTRILARVPDGFDLVALHREGKSWSSEKLSEYLAGLALDSRPGVVFAIGGAFGLSDAVLRRADHRLSLSGFTFPHEMARLILTEQIYRAGTIARGEPYHKGGGG
jgi:23S rRNA (pseudouridine1915-N3)-methyltransferase